MDREQQVGADRRPLRLAFLADPTSIHTRRWLTFFAQRGHDVHLLVADEQEIDPDLAAVITAHRYGRLGRRLVPMLSAVRVRSGLRRLLAQIQPDILHAHYLSRYGWLARLSGFHPYVVTLWGSDVLIAPWQSRRSMWFSRSALRHADLLTVSAEHLGAAAVSLGAPPYRLRTIQFGVDTERFAPRPTDPHLQAHLGLDGRRIVFSPRTLRPLYQHETVVRAAARLPDDVVLLSGARRSDPAHLAALRGLADELGLGDRFVVVPDFTDEEIPALFALADVVVSVPSSDGLPQTVLEAMASGAPVVASDLPGPRACLEGHPELIVPVGDDGALLRAIKGVLDLSPEARRGLGAALRARIEDRFEYRSNMLAMERAYHELLDGPHEP